MKRVAVFIDYRNCFHLAREVFASKPFAKVTDGQFWPSELAQLLIDKAPANERRALSYVGVYTGRPDLRKDPKTAAANSRQLAAWMVRSPTLTLKTRALRYPHSGRYLRPRRRESMSNSRLTRC